MASLNLFLLVVLGLFALLHAQKFNTFKSYAKAKVRPEKYAKRSTRHAISEYLTPIQIKMLNERNSKDTPDVMFDNKWSGFNGFQPKPITRKLGDFESVAGQEAVVESGFVPLYIALGGVFMLGATLMYWLSTRKAALETEERRSEFV